MAALGYALSDSRPRAGAHAVGCGIRQHRGKGNWEESEWAHILAMELATFSFLDPTETRFWLSDGRTESKKGPKHKLERSAGK